MFEVVPSGRSGDASQVEVYTEVWKCARVLIMAFRDSSGVVVIVKVDAPPASVTKPKDINLV